MSDNDLDRIPAVPDSTIPQILLEPLNERNLVIYHLSRNAAASKAITVQGSGYVSVFDEKNQVIMLPMPVSVEAISTKFSTIKIAHDIRSDQVRSIIDVYEILNAEQNLGNDLKTTIIPRVQDVPAISPPISWNTYITGKKSEYPGERSLSVTPGITAGFAYTKDAVPPPRKLLGDSFFSPEEARIFNNMPEKQKSAKWVAMMAQMDRTREYRRINAKAIEKRNIDALQDLLSQRVFGTSYANLTRDQQQSLRAMISADKKQKIPPDTADLIEAVTRGDFDATRRELGRVKARMAAKSNVAAAQLVTLEDLQNADVTSVKVRLFGECLHWLDHAELLVKSDPNIVQNLTDRWSLPVTRDGVYNCRSCSMKLGTIDMRSAFAFSQITGTREKAHSAIYAAVAYVLDQIFTGVKNSKSIFFGMSDEISGPVEELVSIIRKNRGNSPETIENYRKFYAAIYAHAAGCAMVVANAKMRWIVRTPTTKNKPTAAKTDESAAKTDENKTTKKITGGFIRSSGPMKSGVRGGFISGGKSSKISGGFISGGKAKIAAKSPAKSPAKSQAEITAEKKRQERRVRAARKAAEEGLKNVETRKAISAAQAELPIVNAGWNSLNVIADRFKTKLPVSQPLLKDLFKRAYKRARLSLGAVIYAVPTDLGELCQHSWLFRATASAIETSRKNAPVLNAVDLAKRVFGNRDLVDVVTQLNLGESLESQIRLIDPKTAGVFYNAFSDFIMDPYQIPGDAKFKAWIAKHNHLESPESKFKRHSGHAKMDLQKLARIGNRIEKIDFPLSSLYCRDGRMHSLLITPDRDHVVCSRCNVLISLNAPYKVFDAKTKKPVKGVSDADMQAMLEVRSTIRGIMNAFLVICPEGNIHDGRPCKKCSFDSKKVNDVDFMNSYWKKYKDAYTKIQKSMIGYFEPTKKTTATPNKTATTTAATAATATAAMKKIAKMVSDNEKYIDALLKAAKIPKRKYDSIATDDNVKFVRDLYVFASTSWGTFSQYVREPLITRAPSWIVEIAKSSRGRLVLNSNKDPFPGVPASVDDSTIVLNLLFGELATIHSNHGKDFVNAIIGKIIEKSDFFNGGISTTLTAGFTSVDDDSAVGGLTTEEEEEGAQFFLEVDDVDEIDGEEPNFDDM